MGAIKWLSLYTTGFFVNHSLTAGFDSPIKRRSFVWRRLDDEWYYIVFLTNISHSKIFFHLYSLIKWYIVKKVGKTPIKQWKLLKYIIHRCLRDICSI